MTDYVDLMREIASQKLLSGYKERLVFYLGRPYSSCYYPILLLDNHAITSRNQLR